MIVVHLTIFMPPKKSDNGPVNYLTKILITISIPLKPTGLELTVSHHKYSL